VKEKKVLQVYVDKGMKHGQKVVFAGEADEAPGLEAGDIIFVLVEKKHETFKRNGSDLYMEVTIPLIEALGGFTFTVKHLDNRTLIVKSEKGDVIKPGDVRMVQSEGMPIYKKGPYDKGNLYMQFNIEFPKPGFLKDKQIEQLEKILPPRRTAPKITPDMDQVELKKVNLEQQHQRSRMEEDDEDGEPQGSRVQCAQQ